MDGGEDVPGHQPSFSPVADDAESENRQSLVSLPFGTVVVDFDETQQAQPTAHPRHSQNSDQPPFCPPHQFNQPHAMNTTKQNSTRLHHLPRRRQQHENLPENVQQQQPQRYVSERLYNQQQEIQPQDQLRRQHMGNDQPRAPPHHRQHHYQLHRQPSWPQSSFPNANSGETNGYANHTAPSTAPPLRSLPQPEMSTQQTTPWANPRYRTPERHPKDNGRILAPPRAAQPIPISSTPSRFPAAVTSSTPNTPARNTMPYPSHPLKSAHVKPFHVNKNSKLTGTDDSNREGFIGKPTASPGVHVPANQGEFSNSPNIHSGTAIIQRDIGLSFPVISVRFRPRRCQIFLIVLPRSWLKNARTARDWYRWTVFASPTVEALHEFTYVVSHLWRTSGRRSQENWQGNSLVDQRNTGNQTKG